jgi:hypothetical protein
MASAAKQVWQALGTDSSNNSPSRELFQLDMATQSQEGYSSSTGWISFSALALA